MNLRKKIPYHFLIFWLHTLRIVSLLTYIRRNPSLVYALILIVSNRFSINLVSFLFFISRAFQICSLCIAYHRQIRNIKRFLQQNRFPSQLTDHIIKRFLNKQYLVDIKPSSILKLPIFLFLPYLGVNSIHLKKRLTKFLGKIYPLNTPIGSLFPFNDHAHSHVCSSFVYKFTCSNCQVTHYGKTSRHFNVGCREHLGINKKGSSVKGASSAIRDHIKDTGHSSSLDNFCIIDRTNNELDLLIHESLLIPRHRPTLNFQRSSIPLSLF